MKNANPHQYGCWILGRIAINGSGVAVGRALSALIENHGDEKGCAIPQALRPFLGGGDFLSWQP